MLNVLPLSSLILYQSLYFPEALPAGFSMIPRSHLFFSFISILSLARNLTGFGIVFGNLCLVAFLVLILGILVSDSTKSSSSLSLSLLL